MSSPLDFLNVHVNAFKFYGILEIDTDSEFLKVVMFFYAIGTQFVFSDIGCILFTVPLLFFPPAKEVLRIIFTVTAYVNAVLKGKIFITKRKQLRELWSRLHDSDFIAIGNVEREIVNDSKFDINNIINIYTVLGSLNLIVIYVTPILVWEKRLPFFMYVPFGIDQTTAGFVFAYLYQFGNVVYAGGVNIAVNIYLFSMFVCVTYFLSLLSYRVKCLGYPSGMNENWTTTPGSKRSFYKEICGCIALHLKVDKLVREMNEIVNELIFVQIAQAAFLFANSVYLLIGFDLTPDEYIAPLFWLSAFAAEMAIYCYFGNNIIYTFDGIHNSAYSCNFIAFDQKSSLAILKMMTITGGREMKIIAVGFVRFELSLQMLLKILKTTYSIIMVFNTM